MRKYGFNLLWSAEDEGFIATCPDFTGLSAFGETPEAALAEAEVALDLFIESLQASGDPLPEASEAIEYSGQIRLRMPKRLHSSLAANAAKEGVSLNSWLITLLSEGNATASFVNKVCSKIETMNEAIKTHRAETQELAGLIYSTYTSTLSSVVTNMPLFTMGNHSLLADAPKTECCNEAMIMGHSTVAPDSYTLQSVVYH